MLHSHFALQASACRDLGSPFMGRLMDLFANRLTEDTEVGAFLLNWTGDTSSSGHSVPLRVAGALHALVLSAKDETLKTWPRDNLHILKMDPGVWFSTIFNIN